MIRQRAFTLVEMMVALAVTGLLTVMMLRMFSDSSTIWKTEDDRLDTFREARAALQLMSRDFSSALPLPNATATGITDNYPVLALHGDPQKRSALALSDQIDQFYPAAYLLTSSPNAGLGDLCAVGYFLEWEPSIKPAKAATGAAATPSTPPPRTAFALRRQMAQSDTTFARLRETLPLTPKPPFFGKTAFETLYSTTAPAKLPGGPELPAPNTETIATYIWDLQFSVAKEPPTATTPGATPAPNATPSPGQKGFYGTKLPAWVEIRFKAIGSTAARKLSGNPLVDEELWSKPKDPAYTRLILPAEQQFVSRVKLAR